MRKIRENQRKRTPWNPVGKLWWWRICTENLRRWGGLASLEKLQATLDSLAEAAPTNKAKKDSSMPALVAINKEKPRMDENFIRIGKSWGDAYVFMIFDVWQWSLEKPNKRAISHKRSNPGTSLIVIVLLRGVEGDAGKPSNTSRAQQARVARMVVIRQPNYTCRY